METLSVKVPSEMEEQIEEYADQMDETRSVATRSLIQHGLDETERPDGIIITKPTALLLFGLLLLGTVYLEPQTPLMGPLGAAVAGAGLLWRAYEHLTVHR